jgi:hypothetical protein
LLSLVMAATPFLVPICGPAIYRRLLATSYRWWHRHVIARALTADIPHQRLLYKNPIDIHGTAATIMVPIKSAIM